MIDLCNATNCTGCGVCVESCPHEAISFIYDEWDFRYPIINRDNCVKCGLCIKRCPVLTPVEKNSHNKCYLAWAKNDSIHFESASGGISYIISKHFIEKGGFAVGCVWDKDYNAVLSVIDTVKGLELIKGSKYVQSYIPGDVFKEVKERLANDEKGVFIGLPCQIAAIKSYVKGNNNLLLCDILCHGGCSPRCHKEHLTYIKENTGIKEITDIRFRGGIYDYFYSLWNDKKKVFATTANEDTYYYAFLSHSFFHESCYDCHFATKERVSDITIGDFWGINNSFISDKNHLNGSNLVLIHSSIGEEIWNEIDGDIESFIRPLEEAIQGNDTLRSPTNKPGNRQTLLDSVIALGFEKAIKTDPAYIKKCKIARLNRIKSRIIQLIPKSLKNIIKNINK